MRFLSIFLLLFISRSVSYAQEPAKSDLFPCGAPPGITPFLKAYREHPDQFPQYRNDDMLYVGLKAHLLAKDNGTGRIFWDRFLTAFCRLNQDFAPAKIQFYLKDGIDLIDNTGWYAHSAIPQGIDMMLTNNADDALNTYFVSDPAGNCGYNLPYGGVAIAHSCAGPTDNTWAHEVGHALSLPHPFLGWEGKTYSYNIPTPELLTYDYTYFHDTLDTHVPAPLDTTFVELVDGSNCAVAADRICDSKPDYLSYRWNCDAQTGMSPGLLKDPAGNNFYADGSLYMSYSNDECQNRFTEDEIAIMRATLLNEKQIWLASSELEFPVTALPVQMEPVMDQEAPVSGARLKWTAVPNATHYLVQVSRIPTFAVRDLDIVTTDTTAVCGTLLLNKTYYWRVRPFNMWNACQPFTANASFLTAPLTATYFPDADGWRCYPSLIRPGQSIALEFPEKWLGEDIQVRIFDVAGRLLLNQYTTSHSRHWSMEIPSQNWPAGLLRMVVSSRVGTKVNTLSLIR